MTETTLTAMGVVAEQAEDERLWCRPGTIIEDTLQKELRRLHEAVEGANHRGGSTVRHWKMGA